MIRLDARGQGDARVKLPSSGGTRFNVTIDDYSHQTYEKHETLFLFSCDLVVIAANNTP